MGKLLITCEDGANREVGNITDTELVRLFWRLLQQAHKIRAAASKPCKGKSLLWVAKKSFPDPTKAISRELVRRSIPCWPIQDVNYRPGVNPPSQSAEDLPSLTELFGSVDDPPAQTSVGPEGVSITQIFKDVQVKQPKPNSINLEDLV